MITRSLSSSIFPERSLKIFKNENDKRINKVFRFKCYRLHTEFVSDLNSNYLDLKFMKPV
jgi:hypothetical protein